MKNNTGWGGADRFYFQFEKVCVKVARVFIYKFSDLLNNVLLLR